jgi:two-component system, OmpR family, sensor histidine kinase BaeS
MAPVIFPQAPIIAGNSTVDQSRPDRREPGSTSGRSDPGDWRSFPEALDTAVAILAHEVRGPVLAVRRALERLQADDVSPASRSLIELSKRDLDYLSDLAEALLRWSTGRIRLSREALDLGKLVREAAKSNRLEFDEPGLLQLEFDEPGRLQMEVSHDVIIDADPTFLRAAVGNLIRNALRHSPPDSPVRLTVRSVDGGAVVVVQDHGPGVAEDERQTIFAPFVLGASGRRNGTGTGLGLFIASEVIQAHGGTLTLESEPGKTTFQVWLPTAGS